MADEMPMNASKLPWDALVNLNRSKVRNVRVNSIPENTNKKQKWTSPSVRSDVFVLTFTSGPRATSFENCFVSGRYLYRYNVSIIIKTKANSAGVENELTGNDGNISNRSIDAK